MSDQLSSPSSRDPEAAVQIIGETGGTVVYIFPGGDARVQKGKKLSESFQETAQKTGSLTSSSDSYTRSSTAASIASPSAVASPKKARPQSPISPLAHPGVQKNRSNSPNLAQTARPMSSAADAEALGKKLVEAKLISSVQLQVAKYDLETSSMGLAEILIARGWVSQGAIAPYL